jgi:hypothetical protein
MLLKVWDRQIGQLSILLFVIEFHAGISAGQHDDIVSESNFQLLAIANLSIAGNHESA